jgi:hypothetical protein
MPKKNTSTKSKPKKTEEKELKDLVMTGFDELKNVMRQAKQKFEKADPEVKKKVVAGVVGAAALLAGALGAKAARKHKKK